MSGTKGLALLLALLLLLLSGCAATPSAVEQTGDQQSSREAPDTQDPPGEPEEAEEEQDDGILRMNFSACTYEANLFAHAMNSGPLVPGYNGSMGQGYYTFKRMSFEDGACSVTIPSFRTYRSETADYFYSSFAYFHHPLPEDLELTTGSIPLEETLLALFSLQFDEEVPFRETERMVLEGREFHYVEFLYQHEEGEFKQVTAWTLLDGESWLRINFSTPAEEFETWTPLLKSVLASVKGREETRSPEVQREMEVLYDYGRFLLDLYTLDLSLPPTQREWQSESLRIRDRLITANELLWAVQGESDYEGLPELGTIVFESGEPIQVNITDPSFQGDYAYYNNLSMTLLKGQGGDHQNIILHQNGAKIPGLPYYAGTDYFQYTSSATNTVGVYTAQELREIRESIPYVNTGDIGGGRQITYLTGGQIRVYPTGREETDPYWNSMSPLEQSLNLFLSGVLPNSYIDYSELSFRSPQEAPDQFIMRSAFRCTPRVSLSGSAGGQAVQHSEILRAYAGNSDVVLEEHLEQTAALIFGDGVSFAHQSMEGKTWGYNRYSGTYSHFPGGTGDGYLYLGDYPVILDYADRGDRYEVTIALTNSSLGYAVELDDNAIDAQQTQTILQQSPRAVVTLGKLGDNRFNLIGFQYLGFLEGMEPQ